MYLLIQAKNSISALELKRQLGIPDNAAWRVKHKLMQVMKEQGDQSPLRGLIQLDDVYWEAEAKAANAVVMRARKRLFWPRWRPMKKAIPSRCGLAG
jgi:hypothetical protein